MTIFELLNNPILDLPKNNYGKNYETLYIDTLNEYMDILNKLEDFEIHQQKLRIADAKEIFEKAMFLGKGIIRSIKEYLNGKPYLAFEEFRQTIESSDLVLKTQIILGGESFYRVRISDRKYSFSKKELFHIPFDLKRKIQTQRYSIPGFPCLYLSDSIYTCWEEMKRPDVHNLHASRFKLNKEIGIEVLYIPLPKEEIQTYATNNKITEGIIGAGIDSLLINWPLYLACSVRVKNINDPFKIEYVIPQLLLQYVRQNNYIQGIKYFSTNISYNNSKTQGRFYNYVFPVQTTSKEGYCENLSKTFSITEPVSIKIIQAATGGQKFLYSGEKSNPNHIANIELLNGVSLPYSYSLFWEIERTLNNLDVSIIE